MIKVWNQICNICETCKVFAFSFLRSVFQADAILLVLPAFLAITPSNAQQFHDFGFVRTTGVQVFNQEGVRLDLAWTGGLNACQFHKFDLNFNGIEDLIIFDRHGNRLLTFLNNGTSDEYAYNFAPGFIEHFPEIHHWVQFIDYNGDGKKDIFTYTTGGIKVYKNVSDDKIRFRQVTFPFLRSLYGNIETNLLVTNVDYPAIVDMDDDGDLDILTFWGLGTFLELHTNKSVERFANRDSLVYEKTEYCWGWFAESDESNELTLDTCLNLENLKGVRDEPLRHTGSTLLMLDMAANGLKDLILGDMDYPGLFLLKNEGTYEEALITAVDTLFPSNTSPVRLFSFPVASFIDINNNGINDLVVSPFSPSLKQSKHHESVWFYNNTGSNQFPVFEFIRENLFQHRMIDMGAGAMPVLFDLNGDGLNDLIVSNFGYNDTCFYNDFLNLECKYTSRLALFKNTGSQYAPEFSLISDDFAGLSALGLTALFPAFADLDGDEKPEMLIGNQAGNLLMFKATFKNNGFPVYQLISDNYQQIEVGAYSAPQLIDMDGNGLVDLVIGQQNGKISYYRNQGSTSEALFVKITDQLGAVNVTDFMFSYTGHSIPQFFRDAQNKLRLFVGSESGRIYYYRDIDNNLDGTFTLAEERLLLINEGIRTAPAVAFLTNADYPDMVVGNYGGGLSFFEGSEPKPIGIDHPSPDLQSWLRVYPNPASGYVNVVVERQKPMNIRLRMFDFTGRLVHHADLGCSQSVNIPVSQLAPGLYLLAIEFIEKHGVAHHVTHKLMISR